MQLSLDPSLALADLPFGTPRTVVQDFFDGDPRPFHRSQASRESDYWAELGVFAYYDNAGTLEGLELASPAGPSLSGQVLTALPLQKAKQLLRRLDPTMEDEGSSATSKALGIAIWTGAGEHGMVQAVLRFRRGYYD